MDIGWNLVPRTSAMEMRMAAYEALAGIYDALMDDVDYDGWAEYYLNLITRPGLDLRHVCDCACGTGAMSVRLAERGLRVTGVDLSPQMLERAQQKARLSGVQAMFVCQDICRLALPRPADALICACDGVNYLLDDARLNAFFASARQALKPGGALAFDISSPWKLENVLGNAFYGEERDEAAYLWNNRWDAQARTVTMDITFFLREREDLYRRCVEIHVQKAHEPDHLAALLVENGFTDIRVYGDRTFDPPRPQETRIHFSARRE